MSEAAASVPPETVVAVVNGKKVTAGEVQKMVAGVPAQAQQAYLRDPKQFMTEYAWYMYLQSLAEKNKLQEQSPYKEILEFHRMLTLVQAQWNHARNEAVILPEDQKKYYESNKAKFQETRAKLIYIPFSSVPAAGDKKVLSEADAKAKAESIVKQARSGADFVKLVKEHSQDPGSAAQNGDMGVGIRSTTTQIPETMRGAILALKPGEISEPLRHENGYYVFRAESSGVLPFDQVKDDIYKELKDVAFQKWQEKTKAEASIQFQNEKFFEAKPAAAPK